MSNELIRDVPSKDMIKYSWQIPFYEFNRLVSELYELESMPIEEQNNQVIYLMCKQLQIINNGDESLVSYSSIGKDLENVYKSLEDEIEYCCYEISKKILQYIYDYIKKNDPISINIINFINSTVENVVQITIEDNDETKPLELVIKAVYLNSITGSRVKLLYIATHPDTRERFAVYENKDDFEVLVRSIDEFTTPGVFKLIQRPNNFGVGD
jgi:hypothetical protein